MDKSRVTRERGVGPRWCHPADGMRIFRFWSWWQITYQLVSHVTGVIMVLSSSLHNIDDCVFLSHMFSLLSPVSVSPLCSHCLNETIVPAQICWPDARSFFYLLSKKKRNRLLMEVEQSAWGTADSCQQHLFVLQGVSTFFGYLHIYCPEVTQDLTA